MTDFAHKKPITKVELDMTHVFEPEPGKDRHFGFAVDPDTGEQFYVPSGLLQRHDITFDNYVGTTIYGFAQRLIPEDGRARRLLSITEVER